jgi:hypothetical protein
VCVCVCVCVPYSSVSKEHCLRTQHSPIGVSSGSTLFSMRYELNMYNVGFIKECSSSEVSALTVAPCHILLGRLYSFLGCYAMYFGR